MKCGDCKHWEAPDCGGFYGECRIVHDDWADTPPIQIKAFLSFSEVGNASLNTKADFGCVLYEAKG